jgi:hypothetical protein
MGQRTQAIIKFKDDKDNPVKVTYHNQWGYGRILIYAGYAIIKAIDTEIIDDEYSFLREKNRMIEMLCNIMNVNTEKGIYAGFILCGEKGNEFVPLNKCDNNDGFLVLDITDIKNPKYAYVYITYEYDDNDKQKEVYNIITAKEYWDKYKSWYYGYDDTQEILEYVGEWVEYIQNNAKLMTYDELAEYIKSQDY